MPLLLSPFNFLILADSGEIPEAFGKLFGNNIKEFSFSNRKIEDFLSISFKEIESLQKRTTTIETSGIYGRKGFRAFFYFWNIEAMSGRSLEVRFMKGKRTGVEAVVEGVMRFLISYETISNGGLPLHASSFENKGKSYVFCARSSGGKTTISSLFGNGRVMSDDFTLVLRDDKGCFSAMGSLFVGREKQKCISGLFPLEGIYFLKKSERVECMDLPAKDKVGKLLKSVFFYGGSVGLEKKLLATAEKMVKSVKCRELEFNLVDSPLAFL